MAKKNTEYYNITPLEWLGGNTNWFSHYGKQY